MKKFLTTADVAERIGVHPRTVKAWRNRARGEGPPHVVVGNRTVRYSAEALEDWLRQRAQHAA